MNFWVHKHLKIIFACLQFIFMKKLILSLFLLSLFSSCVSNKQLTYFQGEPVTNEEIRKLNNLPYRLQVNDILYINIKAENKDIVSMFTTSQNNASTSNSGGNLYLNGYSVDRHGNIRMPYIGEVNVLGYTTDETRKKIEEELSTYFKNLEKIFVTVKLQGIQFVITGEIGSPGTINLQQNQVSIIDAVANAGDVNLVGNRQNVTVIRNSLDGVKKYTMDLTKIEVFESENFYIQPNDIIYVPPLKQKSWGTGTSGLQTFTTFVTLFSFITSSILLIKTL